MPGVACRAPDGAECDENKTKHCHRSMQSSAYHHHHSIDVKCERNIWHYFNLWSLIFENKTQHCHRSMQSSAPYHPYIHWCWNVRNIYDSISSYDHWSLRKKSSITIIQCNQVLLIIIISIDVEMWGKLYDIISYYDTWSLRTKPSIAKHCSHTRYLSCFLHKHNFWLKPFSTQKCVQLRQT